MCLKLQKVCPTLKINRVFVKKITNSIHITDLFLTFAHKFEYKQFDYRL